jgi:hypothetical protein
LEVRAGEVEKLKVKGTAELCNDVTTHWGCTTPIPFELTEELLHRRRRVEAREDKSDRERLDQIFGSRRRD